MRATTLTLALVSTSCAFTMSFDDYRAVPEAPPASGNPPAPSPATVVGAPIKVDAHAAGVPVAFHAADGSVLAVVRSGADGIASSTVDATMVTASPREGALLTYAGIAHGDSLSLPARTTSLKPALGELRVRLPKITVDYYSYSAEILPPQTYGSWRDGTGDDPYVDIPVFEDMIAPDGTIAVLARAGSSGTPVSVQCIVKKALKATIRPEAEISLLDETWRPPYLVVVKASASDGRPTNASYSLSAMLGEVPVPTSCTWPDSDAVPPSASGRFYLSPGLGDDTLVTAIVSDGPAFTTIRRRAKIDVPNVDLVVPPSPVSARVDSTEDTGALRVRWEGVPDAAVGTIVTVTTNVGTDFDPSTSTWTFIEPPSSRERVLPTLPPELRQPKTSWKKADETRVESYVAGVIADLDGLRRWSVASPPPPAGREILSVGMTVKP